ERHGRVNFRSPTENCGNLNDLMYPARGVGVASVGYTQPLRVADRASDADHVADYLRDGYAIVRGLFTRSEIAEIAAACDRLDAEGIAHGRSFRHGNLFYNIASGADGEPLVRMVQWPSYHQSVLNRLRLDTRIARILEPL